MDAQLDNLSIADLQARYGLRSRQAVYDRLGHLKLKPARGRVDAIQIQKMDALHEWLKQVGAKMADYPVDNSGELETLPTGPLDMTGQLLEPPAWLLPLMQMLSDRFNQDPLANLRALEEVAERKWTLPTSKLASLLELHPSYLRSLRVYKKSVFTCTKVSKQGREAAWKVERA
uniref:hypothetical protein n=1 Tax=Trichocoleus desertorum TaxID=1481672 RepID=UPI0025B62417|nr:hypothetical protein [Trichocoleus desertorum]